MFIGSGQVVHNWAVGARPLIRTGYNSLLQLLDPLLRGGVKLSHKLNCVP